MNKEKCESLIQKYRSEIDILRAEMGRITTLEFSVNCQKIKLLEEVIRQIGMVLDCK